MARRETFYITPDNPARVFALDWLPASMTVTNTSNYTVYVAIGQRIVPGTSNNTGVVPPFSSYSAAPGGAYVFSVAVDHAGDTSPYYLYPIVVSFSEIAGDVSAPLSAAFPNTVKAQIVRYSKAQTITGFSTIQWDRTQSTFNQINFDQNTFSIVRESILDVTLNLPITNITGTPTAITVQINGGATIVSFSEFPRSGQTSTIINLRKIVALKANQSISVTWAFSPGSAGGSIAADAATLTANLLA